MRRNPTGCHLKDMMRLADKVKHYVVAIGPAMPTSSLRLHDKDLSFLQGSLWGGGASNLVHCDSSRVWMVSATAASRMDSKLSACLNP